MSKQIEVATLQSYPHHNMLNYCENRPKYRQGRKLTAVKVYTVNDESQHLLIRGVPSINLHNEVEKLCARYGDVLSIRQVQFEDQEEFTHSFHVTFVRLQSARFAKKQIDTRNFFGGILHICYAPELETIEQTRVKLQTRISEVMKHIDKFGLNNNKKESEVIQQDATNTSHNQMVHGSTSYSQKQNRWLEGGLKCSYIIPKSNSLNNTKEVEKNKVNIVNVSTTFDSKKLKFVPRQLSIANTEPKIKKCNRIIFH